MSVLKAHITASYTPPVATGAAVVVEERHTAYTSDTHTGGTSVLEDVDPDRGIESDEGSTSINKDLYREVRRYLGLG